MAFIWATFYVLLVYRNRIERTNSKRWRGSVRRVVSAGIYNLSCFSHGCSTGWVSGVLGSEALAGGAWLAALPCLVALPAAPFFAVLADARGRKAGAFCICLSFIMSWSLAAWCGTRGVWASRVAAGAGGAGAIALAPIYCAEIAPRNRALTTLPVLACSCGILYAYAAGGMLSAHTLSLSMVVPPIVLLVSLLWIPETPSFLISIGRIQDAAKVMCWFEGSDFQEDLTDVIEQQEVRIRTSESYGSQKRPGLCRLDSETFQPMLKRSSGLESNNSDRKTEPSACRELFRHRKSRRALISCCILVTLSAGSGAGAVTSFAASLLRYTARAAAAAAVPTLNTTAYNISVYNGTMPRGLFQTSEAASMFCGTALVLGAALATVTVDKVGRKMLLIWSCSGIACCLAILGAYCDPRLRMYSWSHTYQLWPYKYRLSNDNTEITKQIVVVPDVYNSSVEKGVNGSLLADNLYEDDTKNEGKFIGGIILKRDAGKNATRSKDDDKIWPPVILLSTILFLYNIGLGSVPFVLISELFCINARSLASSFLTSWMWLSSFLLLRYFGAASLSLGLHSTYYVCASITFLGAWYICLFIPETRGKSQKQIDEALEGPLLVGFKRRRKNREDP